MQSKLVTRGIYALAGAALLFVSGWVGWGLHTQPNRDVQVTSTFSGTLSNLNIDHNSGCVQATSKHVCGAFLAFDPASLHDGQSVQIASEYYTDNRGNKTLLLAVVPTARQVN